MNTGLRAQDLTSIRVRDVDLANGLLHVTNHKSHLEDSLPITLELDQELRRWLARGVDDLMQALKGAWYLFPARDWARWANRGDGPVQVVGPWEPPRRLAKPAAVVQRALLSSGLTDVKYEGVHTLRRSVGRAFFEHASNLGHDATMPRCAPPRACCTTLP